MGRQDSAKDEQLLGGEPSGSQRLRGARSVDLIGALSLREGGGGGEGGIHLLSSNSSEG
jgi:hypothetical protein